MATPHVAGVAALLFAAGAKTPEQVERALYAGASGPAAGMPSGAMASSTRPGRCARSASTPPVDWQPLAASAAILILLFCRLNPKVRPGGALNVLLDPRLLLPLLLSRWASSCFASSGSAGWAARPAVVDALSLPLPDWERIVFGRGRLAHPLFYSALLPLLLALPAVAWKGFRPVAAGHCARLRRLPRLRRLDAGTGTLLASLPRAGHAVAGGQCAGLRAARPGPVGQAGEGMKLKGRVTFEDFGAGAWILVSEDGKRYELQASPAANSRRGRGWRWKGTWTRGRQAPPWRPHLSREARHLRLRQGVAQRTPAWPVPGGRLAKRAAWLAGVPGAQGPASGQRVVKSVAGQAGGENPDAGPARQVELCVFALSATTATNWPVVRS